jgi:hypothetical protein
VEHDDAVDGLPVVAGTLTHLRGGSVVVQRVRDGDGLPVGQGPVRAGW